MSFKYCDKCNEIKPPRAHHCSACNACYLQMDHHCPWVGNCVAFNNHKLFLHFLFWTSTGCSYSVFTMGISRVAHLSQYDYIDDNALLHMLIASIVSLLFAVSTIGLFISQLFFAVTSMSTIEVRDL